MSKLNAQQLSAVRTTDRPLLVIAGAGSGKTRVITEKISYLIEQGLQARHIAAVTFTNKAAQEMKARVAQHVTKKNIRGLRVSTFHSLGLDIIKREHTALGLKSGISIMDEQDKTALLKELIKQGSFGCVEEELDQYAKQISSWKNDFVVPQDPCLKTDPLYLTAGSLYKQYTKQLKAYNSVDFDDLILVPVLLFQKTAEILEYWRNRIRYLLIDEYQDTNITQYQLVRLLAGTLGKLTVVGDDDQSIYAWRGARPENLARLRKDFPRLAVIKLEQNYRSSGRILKAANRLIANNPHDFEKRLWSQLGYGDMLRVLSHKDELSEARQVVSDIAHQNFKSQSSYRDYAILYRGNHQSRLFERVFREQGIPYFISGSTPFFAYAEIKDIVAYLRLLVNQHDDIAFLRIVNTPKREIGPATLEKLSNYATLRGIGLLSACFEFGLQQQLSDQAFRRLQKFCEWIVKTADRIERGDPFEIIQTMIQELDYEQWLRDTANSPKSAERKIQNISELIEWLKRLSRQDGQELPLSEVLTKIMLIDILERNQQDETGDRVTLMTLHAAKGLEFPNVYLIGFEENLLPHATSIQDDFIEEERRLAYVGITRAQKTLTFSYCRHRKRYGDMESCEPSRFLSELPEQDLNWPEKKPIDPEQKKQLAQENFAQIRNLLSIK